MVGSNYFHKYFPRKNLADYQLFSILFVYIEKKRRGVGPSLMFTSIIPHTYLRFFYTTYMFIYLYLYMNIYTRYY